MTNLVQILKSKFELGQAGKEGERDKAPELSLLAQVRSVDISGLMDQISYLSLSGSLPHPIVIFSGCARLVAFNLSHFLCLVLCPIVCVPARAQCLSKEINLASVVVFPPLGTRIECLRLQFSVFPDSLYFIVSAYHQSKQAPRPGP